MPHKMFSSHDSKQLQGYLVHHLTYSLNIKYRGICDVGSNLLERFPRCVQGILDNILNVDIVVDEPQSFPKVTHSRICDQYQLHHGREPHLI